MKQKIKKTAVGILAAAMMLSMGAASVFAAGYGRHFTDADGNGICDHAESVCCYVDSDNDGICDNCSNGSHSHNGCGQNFVDNDNDGVCDNYAARPGKEHGRGRGRGYHGGRNK